MSYVLLDKPVQGEATKKPLADGLIDNDAYFNSILSAIQSIQVPNGSFEIDSDADGEPDLWTYSLYTGGAFSLTGDGLADTECQHGRRAIKLTSPGGGGNGGGYVELDDYLECAPTRPVIVSWLHKSSVATIRNIVSILWYTADLTSISTTVLYTSVLNPTSWSRQAGAATPPSTARFFRLRFVGAENTTTVAGSAYFDGLLLHQTIRAGMEVWDSSGTWTCPWDVTKIRVRCWGGGGAGSASNTGGAAGGYGEEILDVVPGSTHAVTIGAGGVGGGTDGGDSSLGSLISATGGESSGGVGGTSAATHNIAGGDGGNGKGGAAGGGGGDGGKHDSGGTGGAGKRPGGGGGSGNSGVPSGASGRIIIEYLS